jgi:hypothetical protein
MHANVRLQSKEELLMPYKVALKTHPHIFVPLYLVAAMILIPDIPRIILTLVKNSFKKKE